MCSNVAKFRAHLTALFAATPLKHMVVNTKKQPWLGGACGCCAGVRADSARSGELFFEVGAEGVAPDDVARGEEVEAVVGEVGPEVAVLVGE